MTDIVPRLDTIDFDQLVELARGDIPRSAPAWTDHNLHDPGMTLIDVLAWIVDQQVFRAGFVGGRHRTAFAALLGHRPEGPTPAGGLIWPAAPVVDGRSVPVGAEVVSLRRLDVGFALAWSTDPDTHPAPPPSLYLPPVRSTGAVLVSDGVELPVSVSGRSGAGSLTLAGRDATLTLRFDGPLGATGEVAVVSLGVEVAPPPGPALAPGDRPWGPVGYSYRVVPGPWVELRVVHDGTAGLAGAGAVILELPQAADAAGTSELRIAVGRGFFPVAPQIQAAIINVLPVVQRSRVAPASLGTGTGQPDQAVRLDTTGLLRPPGIRVGADLWTAERDFARSGPDDRHYVLSSDRVLFGNGVNGLRPGSGADIRHGELFRTLGAAGNLPRGLPWAVPALGPATFGTNRAAIAGGADRAGVDDLAVAAREAAVSRSALLTDRELVEAARALTGLAVGRAEVLPGFDRRLMGRRVDGVRTLVVVPGRRPPSGPGRPAPPVVPSQAYLDAVAARLAHRRVLGERLVVQGPAVVAVEVEVEVVRAAGAVADDVGTAVREAVHGRLAIVAGRGGAEPWPLGRDLTAVDLELVAATAPGVERVLSVRVGVAGGPLGTDPVPVPPDGLVVAGRVDVVAGTGPAGGRAR